MKRSENEKLFIALLRAGLWGGALDTSLFKGTIDWDRIYRLSMEQTVLAIVGDGLEQLPTGVRPPRSLIYKWSAQTIAIERRNETLNAFLPKLSRFLQKNHVKFWIMKGQGLARHYINPQHRQSGDIDISVEDSNFEKVKILLSALPHRDEECSLDMLHYALNVDGVELELHGNMNSRINRDVDKHFGAWLEKCMYEAPLTTYREKDTSIPIPSPDFNALYVFMHLFRHYLQGGIGLRQVCDWACLLADCHEALDIKDLEVTLNSFHLMKAWQYFGYVAVNSLGLAKEKMPFYCDTCAKEASIILTNILKQGNFGHNNKYLSKQPGAYFLRKVHSFYYKNKAKLEHLPLFPNETIYSILTGWKYSLTYLFHGR